MNNEDIDSQRIKIRLDLLGNAGDEVAGALKPTWAMGGKILKCTKRQQCRTPKSPLDGGKLGEVRVEEKLRLSKKQVGALRGLNRRNIYRPYRSIYLSRNIPRQLQK